MEMDKVNRCAASREDALGYVEFERSPEALHKRHRTGLCEAFRNARFVGQVRGDGAAEAKVLRRSTSPIPS